jgi:hypothetical protein
MAAEKSEGGGSFLANPSALLALVTIAGGVWLVSQKLTSDRPVTPAGGAMEFLGDQKVEARLWEDPFKNVTIGNQETMFGSDSRVAIDLATLGGQIGRKSNPDGLSNSADPAKIVSTAKPVLLLPVMLSGGQYSEDQESRIRSRFAIVSALGESGYVPDDAEHIGSLRLPWLTQQEMAEAKLRASKSSADLKYLWELDPAEADLPDRKESLMSVVATAQSAHLEVRYEWYRPRVFSAGSALDPNRPSVLVLWLDDAAFEDEPLLRLPLFLERLTDPYWLPPGTPPPAVRLIGPRRTVTLRSMLPTWEPGPPLWSTNLYQRLRSPAQEVLKRIEIFCATPSAMDEVLVKDPPSPDQTPRWSVGNKLTNTSEVGFKSFHNFAATDAQMAGEVIEELKLRGADLTDEKNHVVLISEWDTFYARMLSLTYDAELAQRQGKATTRAQYVKRFMAQKERSKEMPANFHSFVFLRGLDGQTVGGNGGAPDEDRAKGRAGKSSPTSIEELRHWAPDVNKAEGQAQFDYLGRLGDRLNALQKNLQRDGEGGEVRAIGIVGSDVYDTLLILQALRPRFPEALFFTTDLDVRFLHPREREWARNLIVASSYGLALHRRLQGSTAPFRDSTQTAQFAAALAALGNKDLAEVVQIPPRRFEVGNGIAVNLSMDSPSSVSTLPSQDPPFRLHPATPSELYRSRSVHYFYRLGWGIVAAVLLLAGAIWSCDPLRQLTLDAFDYPSKALNYLEEDIGGPDGAAGLMLRLDAHRGDPRADRLLNDPQIVNIRTTIEGLEAEFKKKPTDKTAGEKDPEDKPADIAWKRETALGELTARLVKLLNLELPPENPPEKNLLRGGQRTFLDGLNWWLQARPRMVKRYQARRDLDAFLLTVCGGGAGSAAEASARPMRHSAAVPALSPEAEFAGEQMILQEAAIQAAVDARESADGLFRLRRKSLIHFWVSVAGFGLAALGLVCVIWVDTFWRPDGEPFSLTSGISAWPAQVLRLLVLALAVRFCFWLRHKVREAFLTLTRKFRLSAPNPTAVALTDGVCADSIWQEYRNESLKPRGLRIGLLTVGYLVLLAAISQAFGESILQPVRGNVILVLNLVLLVFSILGFLALAFLTVDTATLCRGFIENLSAGPTEYPEATRQHFSRQMGRINNEYLDEWIDLQLIADLTERVGRMVYYPAGLILLLFLARNSWWDCWAWPVSLIVVFASNFILALASVVILQRAAKDAKRVAEQTLTAKVKKLQAQAAPSAAQNNASQAEKLLEEIRGLNRGAFVPFWENPVVGAVFLSSGGTTMLQVFIWFMGR